MTRRNPTKLRRSRARTDKKYNRYRCAICGTSESLTWHHIQPKCRGGSNARDNHQWLCRKCHNHADMLAICNIAW